MDDLQSRGLAFALEHFGAGNTAIRYFKDLLFDILKIDGQSISKIDRAVVKVMLANGRHFDIFRGGHTRGNRDRSLVSARHRGRLPARLIFLCPDGAASLGRGTAKTRLGLRWVHDVAASWMGSFVHRKLLFRAFPSR